MGEDGRFICAYKGCAKRTFTEQENSDTACNYHKGEAIFHDLKKSWSCCAKVVYDWDDFMKLPTCCQGAH